MLATVDAVKEYLGITDTTYDDFLEQQIIIVSDAIENYCGRKFENIKWKQTYYADDYENIPPELKLFHYPIISIDSIEEDSVDISADVRTHKPSGTLKHSDGFFRTGEVLEVVYNAGYDSVPPVVLAVLYSVVGQRYNKKKSGVDLDFGSDVQRISIPGAISIDFDYTLQANERKTAYGLILGNNANILDGFRSERVVTGSGKLQYVEEEP